MRTTPSVTPASGFATGLRSAPQRAIAADKNVMMFKNRFIDYCSWLVSYYELFGEGSGLGYINSFGKSDDIAF